jgi:hypothetical protein
MHAAATSTVTVATCYHRAPPPLPEQRSDGSCSHSPDGSASIGPLKPPVRRERKRERKKKESERRMEKKGEAETQPRPILIVPSHMATWTRN